MPRVAIRIRLSKNLKFLLGEQPLRPTEQDLLVAGERQKARIVERTMRGVDYRGIPFVPYSQKGPFYWYPAGPVRSKVSRQRAVKRLTRLLGRSAQPTRSGLGIRFESYAAFKRSLGRGDIVDLVGPRAPHMLQSMVVTVDHGQIVIGFFDPKKAEIAHGHNTGAMTGRGHKTRLPKREFFNLSEQDRDEIRRDIAASISRRLSSQ